MGKADDLLTLLEHLYSMERVIRMLEKKPHNYGTDDLFHANEAHTLKQIAKNDGITMAKLSDSMLRTKGATTSVVDKLEKKGLILKKQAKDDKRHTHLYITPKGEVVDRNHEQYDKEAMSILAEKLDLSEQQIIDANIVLGKIIQYYMAPAYKNLL